MHPAIGSMTLEWTGWAITITDRSACAHQLGVIGSRFTASCSHTSVFHGTVKMRRFITDAKIQKYRNEAYKQKKRPGMTKVQCKRSEA